MSNSHLTRILIVLAALLICASMMQAQTSPLTATPATVSLTFQKGTGQGSGPGPGVPVLIKSTASTTFTVEGTSVPIWLGLSAMSGTADSTGATITFSPPPSFVLIAVGSYHATVKLDVVGTSALTVLSIPVTLVVTDATPTLTVTGGSGLTFNWTQGAALPMATLVVSSSNEPLGFTVAAAVSSPTSPANWIHVNHTSGVAYSWGTPVVVSFDPLLAYSATLGATLRGTVTITPTVGSALEPINVAITVAAPVAAISQTNGLFPAAIPPQLNAGDTDFYVIAVMGTGFVGGVTAVTVGGGPILPEMVNVVNGSTMMLAIPSKTFLAVAGTVVITAKNNSADTPSSATLTVTTAPIIYAVTSSASYQQPGPGATPNVAPYELISIFGDNFGPSSVVNAVPDPSFLNFPTTLSSSDSNGHPIVVNFYKADGTTPIGAAPLLFASAQQINALVPSGVAGNAKVVITVSFNGTASSPLTSNVVTADPGIFTTNASGTGQGAILNSDYTANSSTVQAKAGNTVMIYVAGLGAPTSTGTNTTQTSQAFPKSCISTAAYMGAVNGQQNKPSPLWTTIDGAVIESGLLATKTFPPCMATSPVVTIGGKAAAVVYAGFVADSVGGLYQINATVPASVTPGTAVPVSVSVGTGANTVTSQPGVTMAVVASSSTSGH